MNSIKKRQLAEIAIHILFWIAVFYAVNVATSSAITIRISRNNAIMERKQIVRFLPATYGTLVLLAILFYGNIFWLFKKILSFRSNLVRFAIAACWFLLIFEMDNVAINLLTPHDPVRIGPPPTQQFDTTLKIKGVPPGPTTISATRHVVLETGHVVSDKMHIVSDNNRLGFIMNMVDRSQLILLLLFIGIMGVSIAYFFLKEWAKTDVLRVKLEANQLSTEVKFLRSQINPHFLFNTLNNLFSMAQAKGNDDLADGISKLSGMMRYMIYDSNADGVPLNKEIEYLEDCITLNKLRYADEEAKVTFDYPAQTEGILVAPMLFISFVENAFKHGVIIGQSSEINISIAMVNKQLVFSCQNTIYNVRKMKDEKGGIGLENIKRRLELVYPGKYELFIKNADNRYIVNLGIILE
ncbi:sensor histidine kinase [uncultured Mucilaginibacter sp.]|uniref:sensor histidine kinase n=1 Tax=uncultured Mucilaginibacter sp. TaxID=797541 RepID=UPI0025F7C6CF|nr:sensor histidine kinase [uncultured Mucilaginibacter sp.]